MDVEMKMPDLSTTGDAVRIVSWSVQVGGKIARGQPLLEVETDKATMEVEAIAGGVLKRVLVAAGDTVAVGQAVAVIESADAAVPGPPEGAAGVGSASGARRDSRTSDSMFARNRARAALESATPTGTSGAAPAAAIPLSVAQRTVARRMQQSKQTIPHYYLERSFDASRIAAFRQAAGGAILWDAFFVIAAGRALRRHERMTYRLDGDQFRPQASDAVNVAVDVNDDLSVVRIAGASTRSAAEISADIQRTVERLRAGDPEAARVQPADLTISNLGGLGVDAFLPIINPPEAAVLGIGRIVPTPVVVENAVVVQPRAMLALCVDHRIVNGRYAAAFLGELVA